ncbi:WYL domain [Phytophthora infestans]|uniref:WYL domain n=2 Tax=Phytophthora infestans TaxID=4787 RepID=A0A833SX01_PHYIN|nr:WYL domain [Phytophthora infestans]KAI9979567.1 hypothetical protein PInf_028973 [Phytophthora infestans]
MRLPYVFAATMATLFVSSNALVNSNQAMLSSPNEQHQRQLRSHQTPVEDQEPAEERSLSKAEMKRLFEAGNSLDDFAKHLGIADDVVRAQSSNTVLQRLMQTDEYMKYSTYLNFLSKQNKKKKPPTFYHL